MKQTIVILTIILCAIMISACTNQPQTKNIGCTLEAKICSDGTAVGRTGPNCEFSACPASNVSNKDITPTENPSEKSLANQPIIIYKTREDYHTFVPVLLDANKTKIIGYPASSDVYYKGTFAYPTKLHKGYLLDNRGVKANSAFLNITYEKYAALTDLSPYKLYTQLRDKNPFIEMYDCSNKFADTTELNTAIDNENLSQCIRII